ncbi:pilus assembly protein PilM [Patescibacteria group bacterium AH-259-L05]|nr:pilus assembly protein PilM [Patescibacteria group bacterium AH-259-L05]
MFSFLQKKSVGLDIADHTIEAVELIRTGAGTRVVNVSRLVLEPGILTRGRIKHKEKLVTAVKKVLLSAKPNPIITKKVYCALPESQVYTHVFDTVLYGKDINARSVVERRRQLILEDIQKTIPLPKEDIVYDSRVIGARAVDRKSINVESVVVAAHKEVVLEWQQFFKDLKIDIDFFDIEALAVFRGLFPKPVKKPVCIIDIGAVTTTVAIFEKIDLRFSYSIYTAGDILTAAIAQELKLKTDKAEEMKIKNGLTGDKTIAQVIKKTLDPIVHDIKESVEYYEAKRQKKVSEIVLVGGSSRLRGLVDYFTKQAGMPVRIGELAFAFGKKKSEKNLFYIGALGMALRTLSKKWEDRHPQISLIREPHVKIKEIKEEEEQIRSRDQSRETQEQKKIKSFRSKERLHQKKVRLQKIILALIVIGGIGLLIAAYTYREREKIQQRKEIQSQALQYSTTQSFDIDIPVAIDEREYTSDRAKGRAITSTILGAQTYDEAVARARIQAEKELQQGEVLWQKPISQESEVLKFPLIIKWVAYVFYDSNDLIIKEVDKLNKNNIDYALNNIVKLKLEPSDNKNIYILTGRVTISVNQLIEIEEPEEESAEETGEEKIDKQPEVIGQEVVKIQETGIAYLNARSGPGTNYDKVGRVYPGKSYPQLQEQDLWYKIKIDDTTEGWIYSIYTTKE